MTVAEAFAAVGDWILWKVVATVTLLWLAKTLLATWLESVERRL